MPCAHKKNRNLIDGKLETIKLEFSVGQRIILQLRFLDVDLTKYIALHVVGSLARFLSKARFIAAHLYQSRLAEF